VPSAASFIALENFPLMVCIGCRKSLPMPLIFSAPFLPKSVMSLPAFLIDEPIPVAIDLPNLSLDA
jgi:hypothetical protein